MPIQAAKMSMKRESWQPGRNRSNTVGVSNGISGLIGYRAMVFMKAAGNELARTISQFHLSENMPYKGSTTLPRM